MEVHEAISKRRSIRKFKPDPVPEEYVEKLLEAARLAPSGSNLQPARYVLIKSAESRQKLSECTPLPFVAKAPVVIACCVDKRAAGKAEERFRELKEAQAFLDTPLDNVDAENYNKNRRSMDEAALKAYFGLNAAISIEHIVLQAVELGLGSCWVMMFDRDKVRKLIDIDEGYDIVALLPVGYPDQLPTQRPRIGMDELLLKEV